MSMPYMNGDRERRRGYETAISDLSTRSVADLMREWKSCNIGDDYDQGYRAALDEAKVGDRE